MPVNVSRLKAGQSDPKLKEEGVWSDFYVPDTDEPLKLRMRSLFSNVARTWEIKRAKENRRFYENDNIPPIDVIDRDDIDRLAEVLVVEWNVMEDDGVTPFACTTKNVRELMRELVDTRRQALAEAAKTARYRRAEVAALAKNSETPSPVSSITAAEGV